MKVRKTNLRSLKAVSKMEYVSQANLLYPEVYHAINQNEEIYDLFVISKDHYMSYVQFTQNVEEETAEVVS